MSIPSHVIAWQGWSVFVPVEWNPVRIDGDHARGTLLLADLHGPRLGLHWSSARNTSVAGAVERRLRDEVGGLVAAEAVAFDATEFTTGRLYFDTDPPGRDVFVGHSRRTGRLLTVVYHASTRSLILRALLGTLQDTRPDAATLWSVFGLAFATPPGVGVRAERLHAGDLAVLLTGPKANGSVLRQVGPASLALARRPLDGWLTRVPFTTPRFYRDWRAAEVVSLHVGDRTVHGLRRVLRRRARFGWAWFVPRTQFVWAVHDASRDRLIVAQGEDADAVAALVRSAVH